MFSMTISFSNGQDEASSDSEYRFSSNGYFSSSQPRLDTYVYQQREAKREAEGKLYGIFLIMVNAKITSFIIDVFIRKGARKHQ